MKISDSSASVLTRLLLSREKEIAESGQPLQVQLFEEVLGRKPSNLPPLTLYMVKRVVFWECPSCKAQNKTLIAEIVKCASCNLEYAIHAK